MPTELVRRVNLDLLFPPFVEKLLAALAACQTRGQDYYAISGFRPWDEQARLWAKFQAGGPRAAPAGLSAHNYGLAVDLAPDGDPNKAGLQPDWSDAKYTILGEEAQKAGLVWGASFNDKPHVQWPGFVSGVELGALKTVWTKNWAGDKNWLPPLRACWAVVLLHSPPGTGTIP